MSWAEVKKYLNNAMSTPLDTLINNVKSVADTINTNVNAVKTATAASSTSNSSGTLSQKLQYLINTWTSTKAGYVDTSISSRQSASTALTQYNALINAINRKAFYKNVVCNTLNTQTTVLSVSGAGEAMISIRYNGTLKVVVDGVAYTDDLYYESGDVYSGVYLAGPGLKIDNDDKDTFNSRSSPTVFKFRTSLAVYGTRITSRRSFDVAVSYNLSAS